MKSYIVFLSIVLLSHQVLSQRQTNDVYSIFRPWTQSLATNGQNMGQQLVQLLGSSFEKWNQMGEQITTSIVTRIEQMENQIHDLAKEVRQTIYNHNLRLNNTQNKRFDEIPKP